MLRGPIYPESLGVVVSIFFVPSRTQPCSLSGLATLFGGTNLFERHVVNLNTSGLVARGWQNPMEKEEMEAGLCKLLHKLFTQQPSIHPILAPPRVGLNPQFAKWTSGCFCVDMR